MWTYLIANYDNEKQAAVFILGHVSAANMCGERSQKRNKMKVVVWDLQTEPRPRTGTRFRQIGAKSLVFLK